MIGQHAKAKGCPEAQYYYEYDTLASTALGWSVLQLRRRDTPNRTTQFTITAMHAGEDLDVQRVKGRHRIAHAQQIFMMT